MELFENLENFNLLKYTDHYVLTIDLGGGSPIIFQGANLDEVLQNVGDWQERVKSSTTIGK